MNHACQSRQKGQKMKNIKQSVAGYAARAALAVNSVLAFTVMPVLSAHADQPDPAAVLGTVEDRQNADVKEAAKPILGMFRSIYQLVMAVGIGMMAISILWAVIRLITSGGGNAREQGKNDIIRILAAAFGLGAVLTVIGLMLSIGKNLPTR